MNCLTNIASWKTRFGFLPICLNPNKADNKHLMLNGGRNDFCLQTAKGKEAEEKQQLFRAEWDSYSNPEEKHPQPHWHITSSQAIEKTLREYANDFEQYDFASLLEAEKGKIIDVKRIHFAMNGNWHSDGCHIHNLNNEQQMVKWLQGVLSHLRTELEAIA
ncbi:MAG: hypothetical protein LBG47_07260 [Prevotellaceae bacterium]|nr:hypothetical protein [Prevotellaceae bacterium]